MNKDQSVAPKERVNITYKAATGDAQEEVELPLKMLVMGHYTGREDDTPIEERKPVNIDKDNFDHVLAEHRLSLTLQVPNQLDEEGGELAVNLQLNSMKDFSPEGVVSQIPELTKLMELRSALTAVKGPLGNTPAFRKRLQSILEDASARTALMKELGLGAEGADKE